MMVGVPVLLVVWVCACWPFVWVMVVGVGVFWWRVFQCWLAVVFSSRRVPGVLAWFGVWVACSGVVGVGVKVFWWFRMLMRVSPLSVSFCLGFVCLFG